MDVNMDMKVARDRGDILARDFAAAVKKKGRS